MDIVTEQPTIPEMVADVIRAKAQMDRVDRDVLEADRLAHRLRTVVYPEALRAFSDADARLRDAIAAQAAQLSGAES